MNLGRVDPAAYRALGALETYLTEGGLRESHRHLLKIRASQLNGCGYCVDLHVSQAVAHGESHRRLHALTVWRESPWFSEEEKVLLALTEEVTYIVGRVSDDTWNRALSLWGQSYLAVVVMAIVAINAWNRVGVATEMVPERPATPGGSILQG
jgi:AhpD family alkylhydroperoxidase